MALQTAAARWSSVAVLLLLPWGVARAGDLPPADEALRARILGWIEGLRADTYQTRAEARRQLLAHGRRARDLLARFRDDGDAEVRRTVREILGPPTPVPAPRPGAGLLATLGRVRVPAATPSLAAALSAIGDPNLAVFRVPGGHPDALALPSDLAGPFFGVLEAILARTGLALPRPFADTGEGRLVARTRDVPPPPAAAAGPLEVRVLAVSRTRTLTAAELPRYSLELEMRWPPSVQLTQFSSPRVVAARDADGHVFSGTAGRATRTYGVGYTQSARRVPLGLQPDEAGAAEALAHLEVEIPGLRLRHDAHAVRFDVAGRLPRVVDGAGRPAVAGSPGLVELRAVRAEGDEHRPQYVVEIAARLPGAVAQASAQVFVTWSDGRRQRLHVMGGRSLSADGTLDLTVRAWPRGRATPKQVEVRWFEREAEGSLAFAFSDVPLR